MISSKVSGSSIARNQNPSHISGINSSTLKKMTYVRDSNIKSSGLNKSISGSKLVLPFKKTDSKIVKEH